MKFALFLGCTIPARLPHYDASSRAVLGKLGVEVVDIREFSCCGYPLRNTDRTAAILCAARNLAIAHREGLDIVILCQCGLGMLKHAAYLLEQTPALRAEVNSLLAREGLEYRGAPEINHLLTVLSRHVGLDTITEKITRPYQGLKVATHYGCHALRPSEITHFDDPVNPTIFDTLVGLTGAESVDWQARAECCGAPLLGINDGLAMDLTENKLATARRAGARYLLDACPYCHLQFDAVQGMIRRERGGDPLLPPILYPQLLGLSLGIDGETLGLGMNQREISSIAGFLSG